MEKKRSPVILGVAGGSGSGKTTVARNILETVGPSRITFLVQDRYYKDLAWENYEEIESHNFDHPDSLDMELLASHLAKLKLGEPIEAPIYDFVSHRRSETTQTVEARPVVVIEGILLFSDPAVRELLDFKIYVDTAADIRLIRRLQRDIAERGRTFEDVLRQYLATVRPMHEEFIEPSKRYADVIVPEGGENKVAMEMVVARIESLLAAVGG